MIQSTAFYRFLKDGMERGGFANDDVVAIMLPLLEEVQHFHAHGKVAPLHDLGTLLITHGKLDIDERYIRNESNHLARIQALFPETGHTFAITGSYKQSTEVGEHTRLETLDLSIQQEPDAPITAPMYLLNYRCYEIALGHHDAVSDVFVLGMLLASLALSLDFTDKADLEEFVQHRHGMVFVNQRIHPAIANVIVGMTELDRRKRWKDLAEVITTLKNYRDYNPETAADLTRLEQLKNKTGNRQQFIQARLRNRLFDNSRRNRLLYFKPNLKFLNLTVSSVPVVLNYRNIQPETLFYWQGDLAQKIVKGQEIALTKYLRLEDNAYIAPSLDRIRLEANKDVNEYGFSQLKLAVSFLNWYNVKESLTEKIVSPLVLVPVTLSKRKGVKDQYVLQASDDEAEINPVLANLLKDLYDIRLPETVSLTELSMENIFRDLKRQVERAGSGVLLDYVDKPKIKLIHAEAKQALSQYKRRLGKNRKLHSFYNIDYSYSTDNFQPLGLKLYNLYVRPEHSSLEFLLNDDIKPLSANYTAPDTGTANRELYALDEGAVNPFRWEFDLCNVVLGNFNYKKMSLVRDYNTVMDEGINSTVFDQLFTDTPQPLRERQTQAPVSLGDLYSVVQSDPTQNLAVAFARRNESYIIQGPPGTGKSQTITNLIADYVARGKKVLFVCEKRAAIDVVYFRLKQQKLDEFCTLIHDSQSDKKAFIMNMKATAESFAQQRLNPAEQAVERDKLVAQMEKELHTLRLFHGFMKQRLEKAGLQVRELLDIVLATRRYLQSLPTPDWDRVSGYDQWVKYGSAIRNLSRMTREYGGADSFSQHPFRHLSEQFYYLYDHSATVKEDLLRAVSLLDDIAERLNIHDVPTEVTGNISALREFLGDVENLLPLKRANQLALLDRNSETSQQFSHALAHLQAMQTAVTEAADKNVYWIHKLTPTDTENALAIVQKYEGSFFGFLNGTYRRTKKAVAQGYNFARHSIKPGYTQVLQNLRAEQVATDEYRKQKTGYEQRFRLGELFEVENRLKTLYAKVNKSAAGFAKQEQTDVHTLEELLEVKTLFDELDKQLANKLVLTDVLAPEDVERILQSIIDKLKDLPAFLPHLKELGSAEQALKRMVSQENYTPEQLEALLAQSSLERFFHLNLEAKKVEGATLAYHVDRVEKLYKKWLHVNALYIRSLQQQRYLDLVRKSELSMAGKGEKEREEKRLLAEGRKILENEFGKTMRYKSIRELATSESGQIIRELKPVWLMSPLSVSDTLPLQTDYFDVVIFDEASQITLEEGIPPIYRAPQVVIVGDEMQMPPSNFFGSSHADPDDLEDATDTLSEPVPLDADSFLTQGGRKFPSLMLGWHYRSRHESLISFSNASFYENQLLTIPDAVDQQRVWAPIVADKKEDAIPNLDLALARPISYHYLPKGVYEARSNTAEAEYIAETIRELLRRNNGLSLGVVAFSKEQQGEIEDAVLRLCVNDKEFERRLEEEYKRMEDGQFVGLFFKNLENVQGDERDLIIMSTCYGYDAKGRMIMNFGPINRRGGEKRLNVIFSRAKRRMFVVSSIQYTDIKNEYNEGANYFRKYLHYASSASQGDVKTADAVLHSVWQGQAPHASEPKESTVVRELKTVLESNGYVVKTDIGQSRFKCHLGVKKNESDEMFVAGILVDDAQHYGHDDVLEQYLFKPNLLENCGWNVLRVFSKDWYTDAAKVTQYVLQAIEKRPVPEDVVPEPVQPPPADVPPVMEVPKLNLHVFTRLESAENGIGKYWEIRREGSTLVVQYGRLNGKPSRLVKPFENYSIAEREMEKLIRQKMAKGYVKVEA